MTQPLSRFFFVVVALAAGLFTVPRTYGQASLSMIRGTSYSYSGVAPQVGGVTPNVTAWTWLFTIKPLGSSTADNSSSDAYITKTNNVSTSPATGNYTFTVPGSDDAALPTSTSSFKLTVYGSGTGFTGTLFRGTLQVTTQSTTGTVDLSPVLAATTGIQTSVNTANTGITTLLGNIAPSAANLATANAGIANAISALTQLQTSVNALGTGTGTTTLANPTALIGSLPSPGTIRYDWTASNPPTNVSGYRLSYANVSAGEASGVHQTVGNALTYTVSGLDPTKTYYAQVQAYDSNGNFSSFSNEDTHQPSAPALAAPLSLNATGANLAVNFAWPNSTSTGVTGYKFLWGTTSGGPYPNTVNLSTVNSTSLTPKQAGIPLFGVVQTVAGSSVSGNSPEATTSPTTPTAETAFPLGVVPAVNGTIGVPTVIKASDYNYGNTTSAFAGNAVSVGTTGVINNFPQDALSPANYRPSDAGDRNLKINNDTVSPTSTAQVPLAMGTEAVNTYMRYTVSFPTTQIYNFTVRCADGASDPASFHLNLDGNPLSGTVPVTATAGGFSASDWKNVDAGPFSVTAGTHTITWYVDDSYLDFNAIIIKPVTNTGIAINSVSKPAIGNTTVATLSANSGSPLVGSWYTVSGASMQVTAVGGGTATLFNGGSANNTSVTTLSGTMTSTSVPSTGQYSVVGSTGTKSLYVYGTDTPPFAAVIPSVDGGTAPNSTGDTRWCLTPGPTSNGKMVRGNIDATNQGVTQASVRNRAANGAFKEYWVAVRTDSVAGTGTASDPFDWSSASKQITSIGTAPTGENKCYHMAKGSYLWSGNNTCLKNVQYFGAGFDQTVLLGTTFAPFFAPDGYDCDYFAAMDMSLNCDNSDATRSTGCAVYRGSHTRLIRIHAYGWGHPVPSGGGAGQSNAEWFPFFMSGNPNAPMNTDTWLDNVWDRLLIDKPVDSAVSAGTTVAGMGSSNHQGTFTDDNHITHSYMGPGLWYAWNRLGSGYAHAFFAPEVTGCVMNDLETGNYIEPERWGGGSAVDSTWGVCNENHNIHGNFYINVRSPSHFVWSTDSAHSTEEDGQLNGIETFADNEITYEGAAGTALDTGFRPMWAIEPQDSVSNHPNQPIMNIVRITNNHYKGLNNTRDGGVRTNYTTGTIGSLTITGNVFDGPYGNPPIIIVNRSAQTNITSNNNTQNGTLYTIP